MNFVKCFPFLPCPLFSDEWSSWTQTGTSTPTVARTGVPHYGDGQPGFLNTPPPPRQWMSVTLGDEFGLMPVMVEEFWITWEDTVAEGELKDDSQCGLCCLGRWVPVTAMETLVLTCMCWLRRVWSMGWQEGQQLPLPSFKCRGGREDNSFSLSCFLVQNFPSLFNAFFFIDY